MSELPKAYVDLLEVGQGGCGPEARRTCNPSVHVVFHCEDGGDAAIHLILRDEDFNVVAHTFDTPVMGGVYRDGLLSQYADGQPTMSAQNPGPPWRMLEFFIHSSSPTLSQLLKGFRLHRPPEVTWILQAVAAPVEWVCTPEGFPLQRRVLPEWNWDGAREVVFTVYQERGLWRCRGASSGSLPTDEAPQISNVKIKKRGTDDLSGFAEVTVTCKTDIPAVVKAFFNLYQEGGAPGEPLEPVCDPFSGWSSAYSSVGTSHIITLPTDKLYYHQNHPKKCCLKLVACLPQWRHVSWAKSVSELLTFTLP